MKKLLIASLIATSALSAVADETTLYGSVGYNTTALKNNADTARQALNKNRWNLDTDELFWGIKGEENISDNLNAFWKLEFGNNGGKRYAYVGLKGDSWGTFTLGTQDSLFKVVTNYPDIFQGSFWGSTTKYDEGLDHPDNVISYVSPNWSGFQFGLAGILNGKNRSITDTGYGADPDWTTGADFTKSKSFGAGQIGLWYNNYGFYAGLAYQYVNSNFGLVRDGVRGEVVYSEGYTKVSNQPFRGKGGTELIGVAVGYKNDNFKVGLSEQHKAGDGDKAAIAGEYYFGPHTIRAGFAYANSDELNAAPYYGAGVHANNQRQAKNVCSATTTKPYCSNKVYTYALGYQYNLSKRTYTWVEGSYTDWNLSRVPDSTTRKGWKKFDNGYTFKVGLRHDF